MFTDKLVAKIPSTATGTIKQINFENDSICAVGHPIMVIETDDGAEVVVEKAKEPAAAETPISAPQSSPS